MRIALAGNPNSGKTTMFNALTGQSERVGNWAGVTVEKKTHPLKSVYRVGREKPVVIDLPGAYSLSPFTKEESITSAYVTNEQPDVLINTVDATNLGRSLFFTTQLLELGLPMVVALNKTDLNMRRGTTIDANRLAQLLGCPVVETSSATGEGLAALVELAIRAAGETRTPPPAERPQGQPDSREAREQRFDYVNKLVEEVEHRGILPQTQSLSDRLDKLLTNKLIGIPFFALVMFLVFQLSQTYLGAWLAEGMTLPNGRFVPGLVPLLELFQSWVGSLFVNASPLLSALLVDGVIGGVIAVVGFLPLVMVMYFLIALLEDCGYMSRVAVVLDPLFKGVGLSGKAVIPFVMTLGCAVPGIMASRTIRSQRECRAAAMLAPFIPCSAKIPVIALFAGAFFDNAGWVSAVMYLAGLVLIFLGALLVKKVTGYRRRTSYFIIELPEYKLPSFSAAFRTMCSQGWAYLVKAATVILLCNTVVQLLQTFNWSLAVAQTAGDSILASLADPLAYLLIPIVGVHSWQLAAAVVTGFIAKENIVGTLAICFAGLDKLIDAQELALAEGVGAQAAGILAISKAAALAYLMLNLYSPPCFAAIGAMHAEMKSGKWLWGGIGLQLGVGYTVGYLVYTVGTLVYAPASLSLPAALAGFLGVFCFAACILALIRKADREPKKETI